MPRAKKVRNNTDDISQKPPVITIEDREDELIALAIQQAEKELREGVASAQVLTHFLKLGSTKAALEREKLKNENLLLQAKTENLRNTETGVELYEKAIEAMKIYSGNHNND